MSLILGILGQSAGAAGAANSYESIATVTVGSGGATNIEFTSIPSSFEHLQIRYIAQQNVTTDWRGVYMNFNNDTGSNYAFHGLSGSGSSASAYSGASQTLLVPAVASGTANIFSIGIIDILDYKNTNKYKTTRTLYGTERNTTPSFVELNSGLWMNTNAITSIKFTVNATNFTQYTQFALYGIKGV